LARRGGLVIRRPRRGVGETLVDEVPQNRRGYVYAALPGARVDLPGLPLLVADHGPGGPALIRTAVGAQDSGGGANHGVALRGRPRILAVAEVDALEAVEVPVAVGVRLVRGEGLVPVVALGSNSGKHVVVALAGMVRTAGGHQVHGAVLGDDAVAERAGQGG